LSKEEKRAPEKRTVLFLQTSRLPGLGGGFLVDGLVAGIREKKIPL